MSRRVVAVYGSGLLQGISLILLPAAGPILTDPDRHGLSSSEFGLLFLPLITAAIVASGVSARLSRRFGSQRTLWLGLGADLSAMLLLAGSEASPLALLIPAAALLGAGFGLAIATLNAYAFELFAARQDAAVTGLHITTGVGQVGAPLSLVLLDGVGVWWAAPLAVAAALAAMLRFQRCLPLRLASEAETDVAEGMVHLPARVWAWAAVVFLYGAAESVFGNWTAIFLEQDAAFTAAQASAGLAIFWASVSVGRLLFAAVAAVDGPTRPLFVLAPLLVGAAFIALPSVGGYGAALATLVIGGLGLSFFFPYSVSRASAESPALAAAVSGTLVAALMLGAGVSAQLVGLTRNAAGLDSIFRISAVIAAAMFGFAAALTHMRSSHDTTDRHREHDLVAIPLRRR